MATPMLDDLKRGYRLGWWALFLRGLVGLSVGVFILARPLDSVAAFALVIAFWAIFNGLTTTVHAFELRPVAPHWWVSSSRGWSVWRSASRHSTTIPGCP